MTTKGLKGIDALRRSLHEHAEDVKAKARTTLDEINAVNAQKQADLEAADIMRRRLEQEANDKLEELDHVAGQRAYIAFGTSSDAATPEPAPEPPAPVEPAPAEPEPSDGNDGGDNTSVDQPAVQDPDDDDVVPWERRRQARQNEPEPDQAPRFNGRPQTLKEWLLAILGLLIGLAVGVSTRDWFFEDITGAAHDVLVVIWVAGFAALGFFAGGWLGWRLDHRHRREH